MRSEEEIRKDLDETKLAYLKAHDTLPYNQVMPLSQKVLELQTELSDVLSEGATVCPKCGNKPHGMLAEIVVAKGIRFKIYEVGCIPCPNGMRARSGSPSEAITKWNAGELVP